jgi:hypothetical protein
MKKKKGYIGRKKKIQIKGTPSDFARSPEFSVDRFPSAQLQTRFSNETNSANALGFWW